MSDTEEPQQNYQIGQIVYVLSDKAEAIVPAIVVEELVHKKLDGNSVSWKVAVGPPEKKKIVASDELSGEIYTSLEEIQDVMVKRLTVFVDNLVGGAQKRTEKWYGKITKPVPVKANKQSDGKIDPADLIDTIDGRENGVAFRQAPGQTMGAGSLSSAQGDQAQSSIHENIRIRQDVAPGPLVPANSADPRSTLRANLMRMAAPSPEELAVESNSKQDDGEFIVTDDGRRIPVKYNLENQ